VKSCSTTVGDNGASVEGGMNGLYNEMTYFTTGSTWRPRVLAR